MPQITFRWSDGKEDHEIDLVSEGVPAQGDLVEIAIPTTGKPIVAHKWVSYVTWGYHHDGPSVTVHLKDL